MTPFAMKLTCTECPWRRDVAVGRFPPERYAALRETCEPGGLPMVFACHKTPEGEERACAGFLLVHGADNNRVRLAMMQGAYDPSEVRASAPLYDDFAEMARANGYEPEGEEAPR
jgi:hypothetical protein